MKDYEKLRINVEKVGKWFIIIVACLGLIVFINKPKKIGKITIIQKTCSGKVMGVYNNCSNVKNNHGVINFDLQDPNIPFDMISIQGGINIQTKKGE